VPLVGADAGVDHRGWLSVSAVEKSMNAIFTKIAMVEDASTHRRVAAMLAYLASRG